MSMTPEGPRKGRGATLNPDNRFFRTQSTREGDGWDCQAEAAGRLVTTVTATISRSIISRNRSPDIPFEQSINPYQGCEHGCVYCFARPTHAYHDLSPGLDFETRILAKPNAAELLRKELAHPRYQVSPITVGANTDPYQPPERTWKITRSLLEVFLETRHPVTLITKNALILRDVDLLTELARQNLVQVMISVTSLDPHLTQTLEPRASAPHRRLAAIRALHDAGVPTGVLVAPVIPFLNDAEIEAIMAAVADAGADTAGYVLLRLPHEVKTLFRDWLAEHYPLKAERILGVIRDARGGQDYDARFGHRMRGEGIFAELIAQRFRTGVKRHGLNRHRHQLRTDLFVPPAKAVAEKPQMNLF